MKLIYANIEFPHRKYQNDEILDYVRTHSLKTFKGDIDILVKSINFLMDLSGAKSRRWISSQEESAQLVTKVLENVKKQLKSRDLWMKQGVVISASVDRVFSEPGDAYFYAHQLGLPQAHCFDLLDACNSHVRAWHLAHSLLKSKLYKWVLIISSEMKSGFQLIKGQFQERFSFENKQELSWKFPALTLGDAVATSILVDDNDGHNQDWNFEIESNATNAPLCYAHHEGPRQFENRIGSNNIGFNEKNEIIGDHQRGLLQFYCNYTQLESESLNSVVQVWKSLRQTTSSSVPSSNEWLITHCSNSNGWSGAARWAGFSPSKHVNLYSEYGNVVSCSVPGALSLLCSHYPIQSNDKINVWTGAAGSSYFAVQFTLENKWEN